MDGGALGEESVVKDDVIHSNRALSEGIITIAGNADGSTHAIWGKWGTWNESSIELRRWAIVSISAVWSAAGRLFLRRRWLCDSDSRCFFSIHSALTLNTFLTGRVRPIFRKFDYCWSANLAWTEKRSAYKKRLFLIRSLYFQRLNVLGKRKYDIMLGEIERT